MPPLSMRAKAICCHWQLHPHHVWRLEKTAAFGRGADRGSIQTSWAICYPISSGRKEQYAACNSLAGRTLGQACTAEPSSDAEIGSKQSNSCSDIVTTAQSWIVASGAIVSRVSGLPETIALSFSSVLRSRGVADVRVSFFVCLVRFEAWR